ncbi:hypothetical protein [Candidatus Ichthyocystis hellenicum]|uniref:hypothetical protein n=1 Tax=Candidatus Ichthyocystis hellenicum TaxID=1561003 RepID=UPI000B850D7B|nr:hypothetical protein [Candidatus Ichthyocystis hellenicum]
MLGDIIGLAIFFLKKLISVVRNTMTNDGNRHSIFHVVSLLNKCQKTFETGKYINHKKGVFIGLTTDNYPLFWPLEQLQKNHIAFIGESGCGKTMAATNIIAQCTKNFNECSIIFDPKRDLQMINTLYTYLAEENKFHILDLSPQAPPQINPFQDALPADIEMMLISAFQLHNSGNAGVDFYRGEDRDAARLSSNIIYQNKMCFPEFLEHAGKIKEIYKKHAFWRECQQLGFLPALQAHSGMSLADAIQPGHILYVIGNTSQPRVQSAMRLILQIIIQILEKRDLKKCPSVGLFIDELRYVLSETMLTSLSTIRDKNVHLLLAFQDVGNLLESTSVNPKAVESIVMTNTSIKFIYRISHGRTITTLEKISGYSYQKNTFRPHIHAGIISHLPKPQNKKNASVGLIFGDGPAYVIRCSPIEYLPQQFEIYPKVNEHQPCKSGVTSPYDLI